MKTHACFLILLLSHNAFNQEETIPTLVNKHQNSFGISFGTGGGLELADDIKTVTTNQTTRQLVEPSGKPNLAVGLFWEHQWNFVKNHGLLYGIGANYTSFYCGVRFKNPEYLNGQYIAPTKEYILGNYRHSFVSLELPVSYTYAIKTKAGTFNPYLGVTVKAVAYIPYTGRNYGGVGGATSEINGSDTIYYNDHLFRFGTKSMSPIFMPTFGLKYSRDLSNGGKLNISLDYKLFWKRGNTVEAYLNEYDNTENGIEYHYFSAGHPVIYDPSTGGFYGVKQSIFFRVNLSSFNLRVAYTLK